MGFTLFIIDHWLSAILTLCVVGFIAKLFEWAHITPQDPLQIFTGKWDPYGINEQSGMILYHEKIIDDKTGELTGFQTVLIKQDGTKAPVHIGTSSYALANSKKEIHPIEIKPIIKNYKGSCLADKSKRHPWDAARLDEWHAVMSHEAGTGYFSASSSWSTGYTHQKQTQNHDFRNQLECGARVFNFELFAFGPNLKLVLHLHKFIELQDIINDAEKWIAEDLKSRENEFILMGLDFDTDTNVTNKVLQKLEKELHNKGIPFVYDCNFIHKKTIGEIRTESLIKPMWYKGKTLKMKQIIAVPQKCLDFQESETPVTCEGSSWASPSCCTGSGQGKSERIKAMESFFVDVVTGDYEDDSKASETEDNIEGEKQEDGRRRLFMNDQYQESDGDSIPVGYSYEENRSALRHADAFVPRRRNLDSIDRNLTDDSGTTLSDHVTAVELVAVLPAYWNMPSFSSFYDSWINPWISTQDKTERGPIPFEQCTQLNTKIVEWMNKTINKSTEMKHLNVIAVDNVCNGGPELKEMLDGFAPKC